MPDKKVRVCVAGATGHLGVAVVEELLSRDVDVVAIARKHSSLSNSDAVAHLEHLGAHIYYIDVSKPEESFSKALTGATVAISCLASRVVDTDRTSDFWAIDRDANIRFGREALEAGSARHLILVATFEGKDSRSVSEFSAAKETAVDVLASEAGDGDVRFTVIRPTAYFKDLTDRAFDSVWTNNSFRVLGDGLRRINPVSRQDVAKLMADCVVETERSGDILVGGPDTFTFCEIGIVAAGVIGKDAENKLQIRHIPVWILRLRAWILDLVGYWFHVLPARRQAAMLHWLVYVATHDAVAPCYYGEHSLVQEFQQKLALRTKKTSASSN